MVTGEIGPGPGHESCQAGNEVQGLEDDVGGAVAIRCLQLVAYVAVGCEGKPLEEGVVAMQHLSLESTDPDLPQVA